MASFDVALEESSRVFGAGTWRTLVRITLPVLRPAILAAFILAIVRSLASYAVPRVLGMPGQVDVLATYLYQMRSEEHTYELQSLMRISYAVFCLKKTQRANIK